MVGSEYEFQRFIVAQWHLPQSLHPMGGVLSRETGFCLS